MQLSNPSRMVSLFQKQGELVCGANGRVSYLLQLSGQNEATTHIYM